MVTFRRNAVLNEKLLRVLWSGLAEREDMATYPVLVVRRGLRHPHSQVLPIGGRQGDTRRSVLSCFEAFQVKPPLYQRVVARF